MAVNSSIPVVLIIMVYPINSMMMSDWSTTACRRSVKSRYLWRKVYAPRLNGPLEVGTGVVREQPVPLSRLIDIINERFGTDFTPADQLFFDQIVEEAIKDEGMKQAAVVNPGDKFELAFKSLLETFFIERMDQNEDIFVRFMNDIQFQKIVTSWLASEVYDKLRSGSI